MVTMTLYARQKKRHRCKEQTFGLCGRRRGWDDLREQHWNMYVTICETDRQSRFDAWERALRAGALGWPRGMGWGGRWEGGSGWGHMYTHGWFMSVYGKNHYNMSLQLKLKNNKNMGTIIIIFNYYLEEKGMTEEEMAGWRPRVYGHEFE